MQCKIHYPDTVTDRISWTEEIENLSPPPLPSPLLLSLIKAGKISRFGFCAASSSSFFVGGGGGGGWLGLSFYSVQDCSQDYLWDGF